MKVTVDSELCMGHGQCYAYAPDVYEPDADGFCIVLKPVTEGDDSKQAVEGAQACPESAITVSEECNV